MSVTVQWKGDDFARYVNKQAGQCLGIVAVKFADHMRKVVGKKGRGSPAGGSAVTKAGKKLAKATVGKTTRLSRKNVADSIRAARKSRSGKRRKTTREHGFHIPSRPGDPPALQTGHYQSSIVADLSGIGRQVPIARVGSNVAYGRHLEFGTRHMAARPHWRPELKKMAGRMVDLYARSMERRLRAWKGVA